MPIMPGNMPINNKIYYIIISACYVSAFYGLIRRFII